MVGLSSSRVSRLLIVNAHSQANAGDRAIVLGQLRLLKKMFPAATVTITSRTAELDRSLLAGLGVTALRPVFHAPAGFTSGNGEWRKLFRSLVFPRQGWAFLRCLRQADLVMACGGGYFYSTRRLPGFTFWQNYLHIRLAVLFRKKIVFFPQSYGPLANPLSRRLLAGLLASTYVQVAFAREGISLSLLREILPAGTDDRKLRSCPDMAFAFSPDPRLFSPPAGLAGLPHPRLALALRDWDFPGQKTRGARRRKRESYLQALVDTCQALHRDHGASFFIYSQVQGPSSAEDDRLLAGDVLARLGARVPSSHLYSVPTPSGASPDWIIGLLRQGDMLITSRLHAAIFAFLAGVPAVVIGYQHKSAGVLEGMGLGACSLPIENVTVETLFPLCAAVLQNRQDWQDKIRKAVLAARATIEEKFTDLF
jgi:colanic acid/amylovoran biosynthesis protein